MDFLLPYSVYARTHKLIGEFPSDACVNYLRLTS
jgi:hypothetical protein